MRLAGRKDVREEADHLERLGFRYQGLDSAGHHLFDHIEHGEIVLPGSPSARHWRQHHRRNVAKAMGVSVPVVEALIHGQSKPVGKRRRASGRKRSRAPRHLFVAPETVAAPPVKAPVPAVAFEPSDPISRDRRQRWAQLQQEATRENLARPWPWRSAA